MKFNFDDYKGDYAMHCKTEDEAKEFCKLMDRVGRTWDTGRQYTEYTNWENYKGETCYYFNEGEHCHCDYARSEDYTILEWSDFSNPAPVETDKPTVDKVTRQSILDDAEKCVCGGREQDYGSPEKSFEVIANLWGDYLQGCGVEIDFFRWA